MTTTWEFQLSADVLRKLLKALKDKLTLDHRLKNMNVVPRSTKNTNGETEN